MYKCKHFFIQELVPKKVYQERGEAAWELLDDRALKTLDAIREQFGITIVNNWHKGGNRMWSGLRTPDSPWYSPYSQHTLGRAFDCVFNDISAEYVRCYILSHKDEFKYIRGVELGTSWLHFDVRNSQAIKTFTA